MQFGERLLSMSWRPEILYQMPPSRQFVSQACDCSSERNTIHMLGYISIFRSRIAVVSLVCYRKLATGLRFREKNNDLRIC